MKRWPIIRHVRCIWLLYRVERWAWQWVRMGIGLGYPNESDIEHLRLIWKGKA